MREPRRRRRSLAALVTAAICAGALVATSAPAVAAPTTERIAGSDRYQTAAAIAQRDYRNGSEVVYLTLGSDFPDALAGAPAAVADGAPILLTRSGGLPKSTRDRLAALNPGEVRVLGGEQVVKNAVLNEIGATLPRAQVERVSGKNRFETAVAVSKATFSRGVTSAFVVNGQDYPDALTAGPVAGKVDAPVLLVRKEGVPASVRSELRRLEPENIYVLGGSSAVSNQVVNELESLASSKVHRLSGNDRYGTAVSVSQEWFPRGASTVYLSTGLDFPDALAGGPAATQADGPILLIRGDSIPKVVRDEIERLDPDTVVALGGSSVISNAALNSITDPPKPSPGKTEQPRPDKYVTAGAFCGQADRGKTAKTKTG